MPQQQYVTFKLGSEWFGINIILVREITQISAITSVDYAPPYIKGIINLRGQLATVFDLHLCLKRPQETAIQSSKCIILKNAKELKKHQTGNKTTCNETIGLTFDSLENILDIDTDIIQDSPSETSGIEERYIEGIVIINNSLLTLLKVEEILSPQKMHSKLPV